MSTEWAPGVRLYGLGSGLLEVRLETSLEVLGKLGVEAPPAGRHKKALSLMRALNEGRLSVATRDATLLRRVEAANRLAVETFMIALTAFEARRKPRHPFTSDRLRTMLKGAELESDGNDPGRDAQFELYVSANLALGGAEVQRGEPDLRFLLGTQLVGVAAKRIRSPRPDQVVRHVKKAVEQIESSEMRGFIAINADRRFEGQSAIGPDAQLLVEYERIFDEVGAALEKAYASPQVIGCMMFGYTSTWTWPDDELPRLASAVPSRWFAWPDAPEDEQLIDEYRRTWLHRLESRAQRAFDPEFNGLL